MDGGKEELVLPNTRMISVVEQDRVKYVWGNLVYVEEGISDKVGSRNGIGTTWLPFGVES